jgi:hypothetical protein
MINYSDTIGNRTRDLPACSTVSQTTAPPRGTVNNMQLQLSFSALFNADECCTELLLVVIKCVKCRIGLLF